MSRFLNVLALFATIGLSACGSGGGVISGGVISGGVPAAASPGSATGERDGDEMSAQTQALDPAIRPSGLMNTNWLGAPTPSRPYAPTEQAGSSLPASAGTVQPQSYHLNDDGGQGGINLTPAAGSYVALTATHDIFTPGTGIQLPLPPSGETQGNYLYAPTTKSANGACLEIGTSYYRLPGSSGTSAYVYFYDFCAGNGATVNVDGTFLADYVTPATHTRNAHYQLEILEQTSTSPPTWLGRLYNVKTHLWNTIYSTRGSFSGWGGRGWTMYETHYFTTTASPVQCPSGLPAIGASSIHMVTAKNVTVSFTNANSSLYTAAPSETSYGAWGSCFNPTASPSGKMAAASQTFSLLTANSAWSVSSTGS